MKRYLVEFMVAPAQLYWADDVEHAKEQAENAMPEDVIIKVCLLIVEFALS